MLIVIFTGHFLLLTGIGVRATKFFFWGGGADVSLPDSAA